MTSWKHDFREAFRRVSMAHGRSGSETVLFASVTDRQSADPDPEVIENLAARVGLETIPFTAADLLRGNAEYPGLLVLPDGRYASLLGQPAEGWVSCAGAGAASTVEVALGDLGVNHAARYYAFRKVYLNRSEDLGLDHLGQIEHHHWLTGAVRPYWRSFVRVALAALIINILAIASPLFVMHVYDRVLPNQAIPTLWVLAIGVGLAFLFDFLLKTARASLIDYTGRKIDLKIAETLFDKVLSMSMSARTMSTGEFANRVVQYEFVREFFTSNTVATLIDSLFIFIFLLTIYAVGGAMVLAPAVAVLIVLIIGYFAQARIASRIAAAANEAAMRNALLVETISTGETIKALRCEPVLAEKWRDLTLNSAHTSEAIKSISALASNGTQLVQQFVSVAIIVIGAYLFQGGHVTTGAIIAAVMLSGRATAPLGQITMTLSRLRQAILSLKILDKIMEQPGDTPTTTGFVNRKVEHGDLSLEDVAFSYPGTDVRALDGASFHIARGERVGIIGRIGSGKTTLGRLIGQLYQAGEGKISFDGVDAKQYHPAEIRSAVGIAGQNSDLFSGSIKDNLLLADPSATDEELVSMARRVGIDAFIARHPRGFDMPVGEAGKFLSAGQKQAVAIARLLLARPKIIFLDEPSGAMDLASERTLIACLKAAFTGNETIIISTHRHSMLELVDRLIVLDNGKVVADGPKDAVIKALQRQQAPTAETPAVAMGAQA